MEPGDPQPAPPAEPEAQLLAIVHEMAEALRPGGPGPAVSLDSSLERELGFDSLTRMELFQRIEGAFGVTLADESLTRAETPRDLLSALAAASGRGAVAPADAPARPLAGGGAVAPESVRTLTEALIWHAEHHGEREHLRFYADPGAEDPGGLTYGELLEGAQGIAGGLRERGIGAGEAVSLMLPTGLDYFFCFFGILLAGAVPVPIYPPGRPQQLEEHLGRHARILANCRARLLITVAEATRFSRLMAARVDSMDAIVTPAELAGVGEAMVTAGEADLALLQYTSGSTGDPKGVMLDHGALLANIRAMGRALAVSPDDVVVSWLPLYHDMGLIGAWLGSLVLGAPLVVMSPLAFLARPRRWLDAMSRFGGTVSGGPNFAFDACARRIADHELEGLDLGAWRVAFNGAEPVSPATLEAFAARFASVGFRRQALMPVYGLAENSVGLAFAPLGRGPTTLAIDRQTWMKTGRAEDADRAGADVLSVPSCGLPIPGHQVRIVDPAGRELPERREGRLQFQGPSACSGYLGNAEATKALFHGDWLDSGDLAFVFGGEVFVTGRAKDMIVKAGRNIFPAELEDAVGALDGVQKGNVAVFGTAEPTTGTERLVVMAETRRRGDAAEEKIRAAILGLATDLVGTAPDDVVLVAPRSVPKTSSGKIRRQAARQLYETGRAGVRAPSVAFQVVRLTLAGIPGRIRAFVRAVLHRAYGTLAWAGLLSVASVAWAASVPVPSEAWCWGVSRAMLGLLGRVLGIRLEVEGAEHLAGEAPLVIAATHASYLDGPVLMAALPGRFAFVAKGELEGQWVAGPFLRRLGALFVARFDAEKGVADAAKITEALKSGRRLAYFPEGTFTRAPGLLPFQMGAFMAAAESGAPLVPVAIRGTREVLRDGSRMVRPGGRIRVMVAPPVTADGDAAGEDAWMRAVRLRDVVRAELLKRTGEPDLAHEISPLAAARDG